MNFLRLRADNHAQYEIRAYADIMLIHTRKMGTNYLQCIYGL